MYKKLKWNLIFIFFVFFSEFSFVFLISTQDSLKWATVSGNSIYEWIFKTHLKTWSSKHEFLLAEKEIQDTTTKISHQITQTNMLFWQSFQREGRDFSLHGKYNFPTQLWRSHLSAMLPGCTSLTKIPTSPRLGFLRATTLNPRPPTEGLSIVIDSICLP